MADRFIVHGAIGSGSVAVEAALTLAGQAFEVVDTDWSAPMSGPNPLAQVPALVFPDGRLMTESAAILLWIAEAFPAAGLAPPPGDPARAALLRWMAYVSSAIYALYWIRDDPSRVVDDETARAEVRKRLGERIAHCWGVMEAAMEPGAFLLGERLTILDLYVTVVSRWTPRARLHGEIAPRIGTVARRVEADPRLADLWSRRFRLKDET